MIAAGSAVLSYRISLNSTCLTWRKLQQNEPLSSYLGGHSQVNPEDYSTRSLISAPTCQQPEAPNPTEDYDVEQEPSLRLVSQLALVVITNRKCPWEN